MEGEAHIEHKDKKAAIGSMFDSIAGKYDFLNHILSFGIDRIWRAKAIRILKDKYKNPVILDVASGTGDLSIASLKLVPLHVTGIDISEKMLEIGKAKLQSKGYSDWIDLIYGDSEDIPFSNGMFDVVMAAFGVRNFSDTNRGLSEIFRVLKDNGTIMVLEFSKPIHFPFRQLYFFYFTRLLPVIGRAFSRNKNAYRYLPESVMQFPENEKFMEFLKNTGFAELSQRRMTGGIVSVYTGIKKVKQ